MPIYEDVPPLEDDVLELLSDPPVLAAVVTKLPGVDTMIFTVAIEGEPYVYVRDFFPAAGRYGPLSYLEPLARVRDFARVLAEIADAAAGAPRP